VIEAAVDVPHWQPGAADCLDQGLEPAKGRGVALGDTGSTAEVVDGELVMGQRTNGVHGGQQRARRLQRGQHFQPETPGQVKDERIAQADSRTNEITCN